MVNGWSQERKAKQRKAIYAWRPWEKSTGPKSAGGKEVSARNSRKHGQRSREARQELQAFRRLLKELTSDCGT